MKKIVAAVLLVGFVQWTAACGPNTGVIDSASTATPGDDPKGTPSLKLTDVNVTTDEDTAVEATLAPVAVDVTETIKLVIDQKPQHGTFTQNTAADGKTKLSYVPNADFNGEDSLTAHAEAGDTKSKTVKVSIRVNPINDAPTGAGTSATLDEDASVVLDVLSGAGDVDLDTLSAVVAMAPASGSVTTNVDGTFVYTPNANFNGSDSFTFTISDGVATTGPFTASLTINSVNDAPVAFANAFTTSEDTLLTVNAPGVLSDDLDVDSGVLTAVLVSDVSHGSLSLASDGSFTYTPAADYNGADSFTYKVNDGSLDSNTVTVSLSVTAVNDAPVAYAESLTTSEDAALTVSAAGVLSNDADVDGDTLTAVLVSDVSHGSLTLGSDGAVTYTPAADYNGADSFTYKVNDGSLDSNTVTVSLTVSAVNDVPVAYAESFTTSEDGPLTVAASGVLGNDSDIDSGSLTAVLVSDVSHGVLSLASNGSFTYTPSADYFGADSFTYKANDGALDSNTVTVSLTITSVNDTPSFTAGAAPVVLEDAGPQTVGAWVSAISAGPANEAAQSVTFSVTNDNAGLFLVAPGIAADGTLSYTSVTDASGTATLSIVAWDDGGTGNGGVDHSTAQNVLVTVTAVIDNPSDISVTGNEDTTITGNMDVTPDAAYSYVVVTNPAHGALTPNLTTGAFSYVPDANYNGADSFTYQTTGVLGDSSVATASIDVLPVNDAPLVVAGLNVSTNEETPVSDVTSTTDVDGDVILYSVVTAPVGGDISLTALTGAFTYQPYHNFAGSDTFWIEASDGSLGTLIPITVTVNSTDNDPPVAGKFGRVANFATNASYYREIDAGASFSSRLITAATVEAWYKTTTLGGVWGQPGALFALEGEVVLWNSPGTGELVYQFASGTGANWGNSVGTGLYLPVNVWTHVAMVYTGSDLMIYINGVLSYTASGNENLLDADTSRNKFWWGNRESTGYWSFNGQIDDARIWTVARSGAEILAGMQQEIYGGPGLAGYWTFDEPSGNALDHTTGNADATLIGGVGRAASDKDALLATGDEDQVVTGSLIGRDPDGDTLTFLIVSPSPDGTVVLTNAQTGAFTFTPNSNFNGSASFQYTVSDGTFTSGRAIAFVQINPVPDDWHATNVVDSVDEDSTLTSYLSLAFNPDPIALTYNLVTAAVNGNVWLDSVGGFQYFPFTDYYGSDSFVVSLSDGLRTEYSTVNVTVNPVNDKPVIDGPYAATTNDDTMVSGGPLTGSDPVEGTPVTFRVSQQPAGGSVTLGTDTTIFYYTPNHGTSGIDTFYVVSNDGDLDSDPARVDVTVVVVNNPPTLVSATPSISMAEDATATIVVAGTDPDGDPLRGVVSYHPSLGFVTVNGTQITYHAGHNKSGTETIYVTVNDYYVDASNYLPVSVTINPVNDAPVPSAGAIATSMNVAGSTRITAHDPENDSVTYSISSPPAHGVASVSTSGWVTYTPAPGYTGTDALMAQVSDGSLSGTVLINAVIMKPLSSPSLAQICASSSDASYVLLDTPDANSPISSETDVVLSGNIVYNATYDWGPTNLYVDYLGNVTSYTVATGCGTIPFSVTVNFPNQGYPYDPNVWFNYQNNYVTLHVDSVGAPVTGSLSASSLDYGQLITTSIVDAQFVASYNFGGDTSNMNAYVELYGYNFSADRIGTSPDPVTVPVRIRESLNCGNNEWYAELYGYGANNGYFDNFFLFPVQQAALSTYQMLTDFPVNGEDVATSVWVDNCSSSGVVHITSTDPAFAILTTDVTLPSTIAVVYRGSLLASGEKREGSLVFTSDENVVIARLPISAVSHAIDFSLYTAADMNNNYQETIPLPFEFPIDGTFYSAIEVQTMGVITFGQTLDIWDPVDGSPAATGNAQGYPVFAPFWGSNQWFQYPGNDLTNPELPADIYYRLVPDADGGYFEVVYWDLSDDSNSARYVFRVDLYRDGRIRVIYDQMTPSGFETSGYIDSAGNADLYPVWPLGDGTVRWFGPY